MDEYIFIQFYYLWTIQIKQHSYLSDIFPFCSAQNKAVLVKSMPAVHIRTARL